MKNKKLIIHKLKGEHEWAFDTTFTNMATCKICDATFSIASPLFTKDRKWVFLSDEHAGQETIDKICEENYTVYDKQIERIYVTSSGLSKIIFEYNMNKTITTTTSDFKAYVVYDPVTAFDIKVFKMDEYKELLTLFETNNVFKQ